ncbi:AraC family transcriptional regulator [Noviherbaspirillum sp.]|jgi:AraC-like DNA-binding protein|uniref:AraC family transcriptional regulator n=1 Tax=Noviherbaspirillum sp. TaxID=1926288 RepID=UPI0025F9FA23|nr:AraC family transcriptional regulator [Noviherbaspirillum sp.]
MARPTDTPANPVFWRDPALPFFEARWVQDGRKVCYERHWHETFSVGVITGGRSTYINGRNAQRVGEGATVVMNPGEVHACNPIGDDPWSYRMFYLDSEWLGRVQGELQGSSEPAFRPFATAATCSPNLYAAVNGLYAALTDPDSDHLKRHVSILGFVSSLQNTLEPGPLRCIDGGQKVERAASYIDDNFARPLKLDDICAAADLSASYLIRAFKKRYGVAPHEYQTNRRIQYGKAQLRRGRPIAEVALEAGFADQAHFQRTFKRLTAATPGQYRSWKP